MNRFQETHNRAIEFFRKDRKYDAAVTFEQARQIAKEYQMFSDAASVAIWAAVSWYESNHPLRAYMILIDVLNDPSIISNIHELWVAKKKVIDISHSYYPDLKNLEKRLENLDVFQKENPHLPISDLHNIKGGFLLSQGLWLMALNEYELGFSNYNERGYSMYAYTDSAIHCNLRLGDFKAAMRWCEILEKMEGDIPVGRVYLYTQQANLAIYNGDYLESEKYSVNAEKKQEVVQYGPGSFCEIRVRTLLLQSELGDPASQNHPSRFRLGKKFEGKPSIFDNYRRSLVRVDYSLACVRYSLGIPPTDDYWYQQPQQIPIALPTDFCISNFQHRVQIALRRINLARKLATMTDICFQCDWRQHEVHQRKLRLDELNNITKSLI
jgi:hypothetical protein